MLNGHMDPRSITRLAKQVEALEPDSHRDKVSALNARIAIVDPKHGGGPTPDYLNDIGCAFNLVPTGLFRDVRDLGDGGLPTAYLYAPDDVSVWATGRDMKAALVAAALKAISQRNSCH